MISHFTGPNSIVDAYGEALFGQSDLVRIEGLVTSETALEALRATQPGIKNYLVEDHVRAYDILIAEVPQLPEAEKLVSAWGSGLADDMQLGQGLYSGPINKLRGSTRPHFDLANFKDGADKKLASMIFGPLALSLGLGMPGTFNGYRFDRDLTDEELRHGSADLTHFEHETHYLRSTRHRDHAATQRRGDAMLIPGVKRPTFHRVIAPLIKGSQRQSICFSHVISPRLKIDLPETELRYRWLTRQPVDVMYLEGKHWPLYLA